MTEKINKTNLSFETSWEVCNMIGGIYTVLSTKAPVMKRSLVTITSPSTRCLERNPQEPDFYRRQNLVQRLAQSCCQRGTFLSYRTLEHREQPDSHPRGFHYFFPKKIRFSLISGNDINSTLSAGNGITSSLPCLVMLSGKSSRASMLFTCTMQNML